MSTDTLILSPLDSIRSHTVLAKMHITSPERSVGMGRFHWLGSASTRLCKFLITSRTACGEP